MSRNASGKVQLLPLVGKIALCAGTATFGPAALTTSVAGSIALNVLGGWAGEALGSIPSLRTFRRKDEPNHDLLDAMDRRGLHLSLGDRRALEALKDRLGITAAGEAG
jgi:hypothetical protein